MSYELKITLAPEAVALMRSVRSAGPRVLQAMAKALDHQNELTIGYAQSNKLTGPRPAYLGVVTNRLRSSLRRSDATVSGTAISGGIGSNVAYAAVHEFGFDGDVQVKPFVRKYRGRDVRVKRKLTANGISFVKAFTRHMHLPERSYIRSSLDERSAIYGEALSQAAIDAIGGATA